MNKLTKIIIIGVVLMATWAASIMYIPTEADEQNTLTIKYFHTIKSENLSEIKFKELTIPVEYEECGLIKYYDETYIICEGFVRNSDTSTISFDDEGKYTYDLDIGSVIKVEHPNTIYIYDVEMGKGE